MDSKSKINLRGRYCRSGIARLLALVVFILSGASLQIIVSCCCGYQLASCETDGHCHHIEVEVREFTFADNRAPSVKPGLDGPASMTANAATDPAGTASSHWRLFVPAPAHAASIRGLFLLNRTLLI
ncbi:MAG: hypothetical protein AB1696_13000 [Planctomycetota bacterium]